MVLVCVLFLPRAKALRASGAKQVPYRASPSHEPSSGLYSPKLTSSQNSADTQARPRHGYPSPKLNQTDRKRCFPLRIHSV